jgi:hypothetical protein
MIILDHHLARSLISRIHRGFILVLIASRPTARENYVESKLQVLEMILNLARPR